MRLSPPRRETLQVMVVLQIITYVISYPATCNCWDDWRDDQNQLATKWGVWNHRAARKRDLQVHD